jgi:transcriptional regulator with XRE-family HTH domain
MPSDQDQPLTRELLNRLRTYVNARRGRGREIAAYLGIEPSSVSDWLNGRTVPSLENGLRIQRILARRRVRLIRNEDSNETRRMARPARGLPNPTNY